MDSYPPTGPGLGQRLEEAVELIEMELRHAISYLNDAVVPQVRRESISAIRTLSEKLHAFADRLDKQSTQQYTQATQATQAPNPPRKDSRL